MRKSRFSGKQIILILREQEQGRPTPEVCRRAHGISANTPGRQVLDNTRLKDLLG